MKLFRRKKEKRVERRKPENAQLRKEFVKQQQAEVQSTLSAAQQLTDETTRRIERLRAIAHLAQGKDS